MHRKRTASPMTTLGTAILAIGLIGGTACRKDPKLNVENAPADGRTAQSAPTQAPAAPDQGAGTAPAQAAPSGMEPGAMPSGHAAAALPAVEPGSGQGESGLAWDTPAGWVAEPPANSMRRAQYRIPGAGGDAELVVFYFGPNQGGPPIDNAKRWAMQFTQPDGGDPLAALKTRTDEINGIPMLMVETTGTYNSGTMSGGPSVAMENWALLGVVAQGGDANWFFKLTGPRQTVDAQRGGFEKMIASLRRGA
jgi:hypothetical protein